MQTTQNRIQCKIHKTELILGVAMVIISIIIPNFVLYRNFEIYEYIEKAIDLWDKEFLLYAAFRMILQNTLQVFPIFFSVFLLMDSIEIKIKEKPNIYLKIFFGLILIQIIYFIIYKIYFDMDYYFGKVAILEMTYLVFHSNQKFKKISLFKRNFILLLVFIGIQCLDITQYFSMLDYKNTGELFFDLKSVALLMEAEKILNLIGILFFVLFIIFSISLLLIFFDHEREKEIYENEKKIAKTISELKIQEIENRYFKEIQYLVHDLKTPLFSIGTLIEILEMQEENEKKLDYYRRIEKSLERCNIMVSEILRDTRKNPIDINKVFTFILSYLSTHKCIECIEYKNYCSEKKVRINKIVFSRAITNLIINSYEASATKIFLTVKDYIKFILIKIEDNGRGMDNDELKNAFNKGFSKKNSSGMGLNFVKAVMEEHNCKIFIKNRTSGGVGVYIIIKGEK